MLAPRRGRSPVIGVLAVPPWRAGLEVSVLPEDYRDLRAAREEQAARRDRPSATGADQITRTQVEAGHHRLLATLFGIV